jgi:hypothetical protein
VVVKLINTDGMALIGPGSEWFWTALSGIVLAVTFIAIWRQLSMARGASVREQLASLDREWLSERLMRHQLAVLVALRDGADHADIPDGPASGIANWWESVAQLARSGDLDRKLLSPNYGLHAQAWWAILAPYVRQKRAEQGNPHNFEDNEWLAGIMAEMDRRTGRPPVDETTLGPLEVLIARLQERLRVEEVLRTVIVASPEILPAARPAATAPAQG